MVLLGAHESVSGGLHLAFERIEQVQGEALQVFTRNQRQWKAPPLETEEVVLFRQAWEKRNWMPVASHASYLINLATSDPAKAKKAVNALADELQRCVALGIQYVVIHPGSHGGAGVEAALEQVAIHTRRAFEKADLYSSATKLLLETTAGQGTGLGSQFEELAWLLQQDTIGDHLGVCVDTCHIFAAGYDIRDEKAYEQTMNTLEATIGLSKVHFFHLNDSKKGCGSRVDRHEHIGQGAIGVEGFRLLVNDPRWQGFPMTLETPKGNVITNELQPALGGAEASVVCAWQHTPDDPPLYEAQTSC